MKDERNKSNIAPQQINPRGVHVYDPLAVVPLAPDNVEQKRDSRGLIHLRLNIPLRGLRKRLAAWLGYNYTRTLELDEVGTLFYERVDGKRTLRDIAGEMAGKCGRDREEMTKQVVLFTKALMTRNLILLRVPGRSRA
jgi:hypothetical protein